jgi:hypothetical protein
MNGNGPSHMEVMDDGRGTPTMNGVGVRDERGSLSDEHGSI